MKWWHEAVFYQIYPRSFFDANGDGVGDIEGIRTQLDYLTSLAVDALWISPIFPSPMADFGYDVSDYCNVDPVFGTLEDFDRLLSEAHDRGLRVILDWVPNHTSQEHPWFRDARSSQDSEHRDWYIWRDARSDGSLPNNWLSSWNNEPDWTFDEGSGQYYLHCFLPEQPDLNWANVRVREAMADTLRFWLDRGIDGFRMDVIHLVGKDPDLPNDPDDLLFVGHVPLNDVPVTHDYLRELRRVLEEYPDDRMSVGEVYLLDPEAVATYYGDQDELDLSFNFLSLLTPWRAEAWRDLITRTENAHLNVDAWPTWVLSNHDNQRVASRLGGDPVKIRSSAILLLTLRGTPFMYQGEELGLLNGEIPEDRVVDPGSRDGCRTPMPWTSDYPHGWWGEPWLPFAADRVGYSVETQIDDDESYLHFFRSVLALRRSQPALRRGTFENLNVESHVLRFDRCAGGDVVSVWVNFGREACAIDMQGRSILLRSGGAIDEALLAPGEAVVVA